MFDVLIDLITESDVQLGCIIISGKNTSIYLSSGRTVKLLKSFDVNLPNKHNHGGQSSVRFERLTDEARHNYITKVYENVKQTVKNIPIIIGGIGDLKNKLSEKLVACYQILKVVDLQYDKKSGLNELFSKCSELISSLKIQAEVDSARLFLDFVISDHEMIVYGHEKVKYALESGLMEKVLVHASLESEIETIKKLSDMYHTEMLILPEFIEEGQQILKGFGGIVGFLRYKTTLPDYDENTASSGSGESEYEW